MKNSYQLLASKRQIKYACIIFLILGALVLNFGLLEKFGTEELGPDAELYQEIALSILNGEYDFGHKVTPFYPAFIASIYAIFGENISNVYYANIILFTLSIVLLFKTTYLISKNNIISFVLAMGLVLYYPLLKTNFSLLMEIPTFFLLSLALYFIAYFYKSKNYIQIYLSVITFSILTLVNNRFIVLLGIYIIFMGIWAFLKNRSINKSFIIPVVLALILVLPWFGYQYAKYNQIVIFTPVWHNSLVDKFGVFSMVEGQEGNPEETHIVHPEPLSYEFYKERVLRQHEEFTEDRYNELVDESKTIEKSIIYQRFIRYFTLYDNEFKFFYSNDYRLVNPSSNIQKIVQIGILLPIMLFSVFGIFFSFYKKNPLMLLNSLFFGSHIFLHILVHFNDRYRLTIIPVLALLAAYGIKSTYRFARSLLKSKSHFKE